jgi:hypothetical protein
MGRAVFLSILILLAFPLWTQEAAPGAAAIDERLTFVGMRLNDLIERFGAPSAVITSRGNEIWQDDVVFQYAEGDFYIYKDRVWQVKLTSVQGISSGDPKQAVMLILGNSADDRGDHVLSPVTGQNWPLMLRVNFNNTGRVSAIYIYRPDF